MALLNADTNEYEKWFNNPFYQGYTARTDNFFMLLNEILAWDISPSWESSPVNTKTSPAYLPLPNTSNGSQQRFCSNFSWIYGVSVKNQMCAEHTLERFRKCDICLSQNSVSYNMMAATATSRNLGVVMHLFLTFEIHLVADNKLLIYDL